MGRLRRVRQLVERWRGVLGIDPQWEIEVVLEQPPDWAYGAISYDSQCWGVVLSVSPGVAGCELEATVVHELLELALYEQAELWELALGQGLGESAGTRVLRRVIRC